MAQTHHPALAFLLMLFVIWVLFPEGDYQSQSLALSDLVAERLVRYHQALDVLNQTQWGDFAPGQQDDEGERGSKSKYVNLTGFRAEDRLAWEDLQRFRERGVELSHHAVPPVGGQQLWDVAEGETVWANISGTLLGEWIRRPGSANRTYDSYNLTHSVPSMDWIGHRAEWQRNITTDSGRMILRLEGSKAVMEYGQLPADRAPLSGGSIRNVKGTVTIEDNRGSGLNWEMRLWGAHWPRQGVIIMTTTSEKFEGVFGLPHLTPGPDYFHSSQLLLNNTLADAIALKEKNIYTDQTIPWNSDVESPMYTLNPSPRCEFIMYAQIHPPGLEDFHRDPMEPGGQSIESIINAIEAELESPQGAPIHVIPKLKLSTILYSPDCAYFLESKGPPDFPPGQADHLTGVKHEVHIHHVKTWLLVYAVVVFGQVYILKNQMKETFTPSTLGRVSFGTTSIMVIVDGMTFTAAATWVSSAAATFLPTLALMFASFLSMTIGGSFLARIYEVQTPSRVRREGSGGGGGQVLSASADASSTPSTARLTPNDEPGSGPILPGPVTAGRRVSMVPPRHPSSRVPPPPYQAPSIRDIADGASAIPVLGGQGEGAVGEVGTVGATEAPAVATRTQPATSTRRQTFQAIIGRYILFSLCVSFLAISSTTWYASVRSVFMNTCAFIYLSLWAPQIYRNVMRNCRRALKWQFVVGQSVLRLLPIAYFWVKKDNFVYAAVDRRAFAVLCAWLWLQIFVLAAQDAVGPRFGVPAAWTPEAWDYHPVLREDNVEAGGLPIGLVAEDSPHLDRGRQSTDDHIDSDTNLNSNSSSNANDDVKNISSMSSNSNDHNDNDRGASDTSHRSKAPTSSSSSSSQTSKKLGAGGVRTIDCAICRESLEVPVVKAGEDDTTVAGVFARRMYMVTPCRHIFHSTCLEGWMRFRLQCPICREELPPL